MRDLNETRDLSETEVAEVAGGVIAGPNGEGCTDPRKGEDKAQTLSELILAAAGA